ncbi:hypothetical protein ACL90Y_04080 [Micrococcus luteus]
MPSETPLATSRDLERTAALLLADLGVRNKLYVVAWVLGICVVVLGVLILVTVPL